METYIRESKIPAELRPDAVEVPVEADAAIASIKALLLQTPEREAQAKLQAALTKWTNARAFAVQKQAMAPARPAAQPKPSRTLEVDGIKYEQFTLTSFDGVNVGIDHAAGVARIQAIKLKPEQIVALNQTSSSVRIDLGKTAGAITASSGSNAAGERQQRSPHSGQPTTPRGAFGDATPNGDSLPSRSGFMPDVRLPAQSDSSNAADDEQRQELRDVLYKMAGIEIDASARARLSPEERAVREVTDLAKTGVFFMGLGLGQEARKSEKQIPDGLQQNPRTGRREACERS